MTECGKRKSFILDTNVMMHDPNSLLAFEDNNVIVPIYAIQELDKHKYDTGVNGANCRAVSRFLEKHTRRVDPTKGVKLNNGGMLYIDYNGLDFSKLPVGLEQNNDARILLVAMRWRDNPPAPVDEVWLISKDTNLVITARVCGVNADDYQHDKLIKSADELYSGFNEIILPGALLKTLDLAAAHKDNTLHEDAIRDKFDLQALLPNACCLFNIDEKTFPAIYKKDKRLFRLIKRSPNTQYRQQDKRKEVRPKNLEQVFAHALLTDPDISLVTLIGKAGTGKTLMALAAAWEQINNPFRQILVYRPNVPMGRDMGFLPGDIKEKFEPFTWPVVDNMNLIIGDDGCAFKRQQQRKKGPREEVELEKPGQMSLQDLFEHNMLRIDPTTYIRGRSVHGVNLIVDEAQNLTPHEIKTVITRAGHQTKVILTGDIYQIDNTYVDMISNGLTYATERFKGQERFGHITMVKGERSELAELAADLL